MSFDQDVHGTGAIINLFGGPCSGKSTLRGRLFATMKEMGIDCEEVYEWIKGPIWEGRTKIANYQAYVSGKQLRDVERVIGKVEVVITDSPTLLGYYYSGVYGSHYCDSTRQSMIDEFKRLGGHNIFIDRVGPYNTNGRFQTEAEADAVADGIAALLTSLDIPFERFRSNQIGAILASCLTYLDRGDMVDESMKLVTSDDLLYVLTGKRKF